MDCENRFIGEVKRIFQNDCPVKPIPEANAAVRVFTPQKCELYFPFEFQDGEQALGVQQRLQQVVDARFHEEFD